MSISRRTFVGSVAAGGAAIAAGLSCSGCGNAVEAAPLLSAPVETDPASKRFGQIAILVPRYPDLSPVGGAVTVLPQVADSVAIASLPFIVPTAGILLAHRGGPADPHPWAAVASPCPHAGCPLGYSAQDDAIECPCHASRFRAAPDPLDGTTYTGEVTHPPARADLPYWDVGVEGDTVWIDLGGRHSGADIPPVVNGKVTIDVGQVPSLQSPGGSLVGQPRGLADTLIVIRVDAKTVATLSAVCTHLACNVTWSAGAQRLDCPCHASQFDLSGAVLAGPAPTPLKKYPTSFDGSTITIAVA